MTSPRRNRSVPGSLTPEEAQLWRRVAATVTPLHPPPRPGAVEGAPVAPSAPPPGRIRGRVPDPLPAPPAPPAPRRALTANGLDSTWDRKLARGSVEPDRTIDLHGLTLDGAHARLDATIAEALAAGARVILLITGKPRPQIDADQSGAARGHRRGAIRARLLDWLAASRHAARIAAVRPAQPRHGGAGAVYVVLRRGR